MVYSISRVPERHALADVWSEFLNASYQGLQFILEYLRIQDRCTHKVHTVRDINESDMDG
jgi:hypothetical protein